MKRIIIACGSGVATSTVANQKVSAYLDEHGYSGKYQIEQCQVSELAEKGKSAGINSFISTFISAVCSSLKSYTFLWL